MHTLIPRPVRLNWRPGTPFDINATTISCPDPAVAALWRDTLALPLPAAGESAGIRLVMEETGLGPEGYRLSVTPERVLAVAAAPAGLVNALQTVRQLLPAPRCVEIEDAPRFSWRGAMLDVSRHFMPASFLFRMVDLLAFHKLNVFHLHLTDDQGWRFPSERYPRLTEVGGWRAETLIGPGSTLEPGTTFDGIPHGGCYTRKELTDLVAYAAARNVTVVPEIDLPGHTQAAIAAYPSLGNAGHPLKVWTSWGISEHVLNLSDAAMRFCAGIIAEVAEIFPSPWIHVGGDETPRTEWVNSPVIAEHGLTSENDLQRWFTSQLNDELHALGRRLVGWDEIGDDGPVPPDAAVMSWRGVEGGIAAATGGADTIICPVEPCYFDRYQSRDPGEPLAFPGLPGVNTLEDVYAFDPVPAALPPDAAGRVLGTQFLLWTEYIPDPAHAEYMAFPRGAALAEVAWSSADRDLADFQRRLAAHLPRLDALGVNYRRS
jgi:hexosaminidase